MTKRRLWHLMSIRKGRSLCTTTRRSHSRKSMGKKRRVNWETNNIIKSKGACLNNHSINNIKKINKKFLMKNCQMKTNITRLMTGVTLFHTSRSLSGGLLRTTTMPRQSRWEVAATLRPHLLSETLTSRNMALRKKSIKKMMMNLNVSKKSLKITSSNKS